MSNTRYALSCTKTEDPVNIRHTCMASACVALGVIDICLGGERPRMPTEVKVTVAKWNHADSSYSRRFDLLWESPAREDISADKKGRVMRLVMPWSRRVVAKTLLPPQPADLHAWVVRHEEYGDVFLLSYHTSACRVRIVDTCYEWSALFKSDQIRLAKRANLLLDWRKWVALFLRSDGSFAEPLALHCLLAASAQRIIAEYPETIDLETNFPGARPRLDFIVRLGSLRVSLRKPDYSDGPRRESGFGIRCRYEDYTSKLCAMSPEDLTQEIARANAFEFNRIMLLWEKGALSAPPEVMLKKVLSRTIQRIDTRTIHAYMSGIWRRAGSEQTKCTMLLQMYKARENKRLPDHALSRFFSLCLTRDYETRESLQQLIAATGNEALRAAFERVLASSRKMVSPAKKRRSSRTMPRP